MYDPYLTSEIMVLIVKKECERHGVSFQYFYDKILQNRPLPITRGQLIDLLDDLMATAFWTDYDSMYAGVEYPEHTQKTAKNKEHHH